MNDRAAPPDVEDTAETDPVAGPDDEQRTDETAAAATHAEDQLMELIAHELRAPLNALVGWSALLEREPYLSPRARAAAEAISRNARSQSRLVEALLDLSLATTRKLDLEMVPLDFLGVVQAALATVRAGASARRVRLRLDCDGGHSWTRGDARQLTQLATQLLDNAIKFSADGAQVVIELVREGDWLRLSVKDAGVGIAPEVLPHVFERFGRGHDRSRHRAGLGIGLALARLIAEGHGGTLEAFSDGPGRGAHFRLTLPAAPELSLVAPPRRDVASRIDGVRVLLVDDDADARLLATMVLRDAGATVVTASSAAEARREFATQPFDAVVTDLGMPFESGIELVRDLMASPGGRRLATVALTAYGGAEDRAEARAAGFLAHLTKPCEPDVLVSTLARLVTSRHTR